MMHKHTVHKGYTLIDICIVLALIALCATFSVALIPGLRSNAVRSDLALLYQTCLHLKHHALMISNDTQLTIDLHGNRYAYGKRTIHLSPGVRFGRAPSTPPLNGHDDTTGICTFKDQRIVFYKDGAITAGTLYLTDGTRSVALTIAVGSYTYIRRYIYRNGWQLC